MVDNKMVIIVIFDIKLIVLGINGGNCLVI